MPIEWIRPPLWVMRPKDRLFTDMTPMRAGDVSDVFVGGDGGQEMVVAYAKARPVVVLSSYAELRKLRRARVVPLYTYHSETGVGRMRQEITNGLVSSAFHLQGDDRLGLREGALRLDQMQAVDSEFLTHQVATLTDAALAALIDHAARYLRIVDRRPARPDDPR